MSFEAEYQRTEPYLTCFQSKVQNCLDTSDIPAHSFPNFQKKITGKVRDIYICNEIVILVTTDRLSAFDRNIACIPLKGKVLNFLSNWWFNQTKHIVPNYLMASPHPNVTVGKRCEVFRVEFVMRGYLTGSTATSMWTNYAKGCRMYCGHQLPDGLTKNQKLSANLLTPTTKSEKHDELISAEEVLSRGLMTREQWDTCAKYAQDLFTFGQAVALSRGLLLVDTKYEFGVDGVGAVLVVDELHTPDSSRFWAAESYAQRMERGEEPESVDKEFIRRWMVARCDPYSDSQPLPEVPADMVHELARRYILIMEMLTGEKGTFLPQEQQKEQQQEQQQEQQADENMRINEAIREYFAADIAAGKK